MATRSNLDFNTLADKSFTYDIWQDPVVIISIVCVTLIIGLVSGSYPAFFLSSFKPVVVLKGSVAKTGKKSGFLRRLLVVLQFFIAITMITFAYKMAGRVQLASHGPKDILLLKVLAKEERDRRRGTGGFKKAPRGMPVFRIITGEVGELIRGIRTINSPV